VNFILLTTTAIKIGTVYFICLSPRFYSHHCPSLRCSLQMPSAVVVEAVPAVAVTVPVVAVTVAAFAPCRKMHHGNCCFSHSSCLFLPSPCPALAAIAPLSTVISTANNNIIMVNSNITCFLHVLFTRAFYTCFFANGGARRRSCFDFFKPFSDLLKSHASGGSPR
jgi:hypothetical protein